MLDNEELAKIRYIDEDGETPGFRPSSSTACSTRGTAAARRWPRPLDAVCDEVVDGDRGGANIVILSDRNTGPTARRSRVCCSTSAVHHHLVAEHLRTARR